MDRQANMVETERRAAVKEAYIEGKEIHCRLKGSEKDWMYTNQPLWN